MPRRAAVLRLAQAPQGQRDPAGHVLASPDPPLPACRLPRFPAGPFRGAPRQTLSQNGSAALGALYTVANELAVLAESTTDPMLRGRALGEYGKLCFGIVRLSVGIAHTVEAARGGQESLISLVELPARDPGGPSPRWWRRQSGTASTSGRVPIAGAGCA